MRHVFRRSLLIVSATAIVSFVTSLTVRAAETRDIRFPVDGPVSFHDDFGDARSGGRVHEGNDLIGAKMMPLVSAVDGWVKRLVIPEASYGYEIVLEDADGYEYNYLHVNNDTPGTDDGNGGPQNAYAPDILAAYQNQGGGGEDDWWSGHHGGGTRVAVTKGQFVGWMGDSGNAENVGAHLHFEIRRPDGTAVDPFESLRAARVGGTFDRAAATAAASSINVDRGLADNAAAKCVAGSRVKTAASKTVYYCGADGRRFVFPNDKIYFSWFADFSGVTVITDDALADLPLGGNVTYRPGTALVKIQSDPKVYAVDANGTLRWVASPEVAAALFGSGWAKKVDDLSDAYFVNYRIGEAITQVK